jgi:hypothetical protein
MITPEYQRLEQLDLLLHKAKKIEKPGETIYNFDDANSAVEFSECLKSFRISSKTIVKVDKSHRDFQVFVNNAFIEKINNCIKHRFELGEIKKYNFEDKQILENYETSKVKNKIKMAEEEVNLPNEKDVIEDPEFTKKSRSRNSTS